MYNIVIISTTKNMADAKITNPTLNQITNFIEENIHSNLTLDDVCKKFFLSKSYLHQLFNEHLGISPKKYIVSKQLYFAQKDIRAGISPTNVAESYGFVNYSSFYRNYKSLFGYSPSDETKRKGFTADDLNEV